MGEVGAFWSMVGEVLAQDGEGCREGGREGDNYEGLFDCESFSREMKATWKKITVFVCVDFIFEECRNECVIRTKSTCSDLWQKSQHVIVAPQLRRGQTCLTSLLTVAENNNACLGNFRLSGRNVRIESNSFLNPWSRSRSASS